MALWLSQRHKYVNCYCSIPVDVIMFSSVAKVSSVGRALVFHAELHYGTVFWGRLFYWLLQDCAGRWTEIRSLKQCHSLSYSTTQHRLSVWASSKWTISAFYSCFCVETETPCSLVVSASKKSDNSEGQMQNTRDSFTLQSLLVIISIYFFLVKRNFAKKGVIVVIGNATQHEGEVREISLTSCVEKYVFFSLSEVSLSSTLVIGVL